MWRLRAACPQWAGYTDTASAEHARVWALAREQGYAAVFNTAVTDLSRWGDVEQLEQAYLRPGCTAADNWRSRLRIALAYLRTLAFLHNTGSPEIVKVCTLGLLLTLHRHNPGVRATGTEANPFGRAVVLKDFKISQFLVSAQRHSLLAILGRVVSNGGPASCTPRGLSSLMRTFCHA